MLSFKKYAIFNPHSMPFRLAIWMNDTKSKDKTLNPEVFQVFTCLEKIRCKAYV